MTCWNCSIRVKSRGTYDWFCFLTDISSLHKQISTLKEKHTKNQGKINFIMYNHQYVPCSSSSSLLSLTPPGGGRWDLAGSEDRGQKGAEPPLPSPPLTSHPHIMFWCQHSLYWVQWNIQWTNSFFKIVRSEMIFSSCGAFLWVAAQLSQIDYPVTLRHLRFAKRFAQQKKIINDLRKSVKWAFCPPSLPLSHCSNALPSLVLVSSS